jgi:RHS repeat-associated protein
VYGSYVDELLAILPASGVVGDRKFVHANHLFSVAALTDNSGAVVERYRYSAYGERTVLAADGVTTRTASLYGNQVGFTGRYLDKETGLWYFRARYYSGSLGRFVGRDPLGYVDGNSLYRAYFSPNALDPAGLAECDCKDCDKLPDMGPLVNDWIKSYVDAERGKHFLHPKKGDYVKAIKDVLGGVNGPAGAENRMLTDPRALIEPAPKDGGKYKGHILWPLYLGPCIKLCGRCVGVDKLGHFFGHGFEYYKIIKDAKTLPEIAKALYEAEMLSHNQEAGAWGLTFTGVYSNADKHANRMGGLFYRDLFNEGATADFRWNFKADICKYVDEFWDENKAGNIYDLKKHPGLKP